MLLAVVAWNVFFIQGISCSTIRMRRLTTATVRDINTELRKLFQSKVPHYVPSIIQFNSFTFATGLNEVTGKAGNVELPLIRVPSISNDLDRVQDYINFCCTDEAVLGCKDAVVRYLHNNPTGDEKNEIRKYYYELIHNTTKYNQFVFHLTCPITEISTVEKKFPNWTIALDDFKQLCIDKGFTDFVDISAHPSVNNYEFISINIPKNVSGTVSPIASLADLKRLYSQNDKHFENEIVKLNEKVQNAPSELKEGIRRFLAEKLVNLYVFHDLPNCAPSTVEMNVLIEFLAKKYRIFGNIQDNDKSVEDLFISSRIKSSFKIGKFIDIKKLPIIVGYDKRKNISLFLDFCKSKSLGAIKDVLDELHGLQTSTEGYGLYLSNHTSNAANIRSDFTTISFDDFNMILQKKINYRVITVGIPDFSALLMKHSFCSDSLNLSFPDLAYNSSSSSSEAFSIKNFLTASSEFHKKTIDDIAKTAITSNNVNNGMMYCDTIISTIFRTSEIQRYNTAIGWKEPSVIDFADQRRFLPYTIVDYVTLDEKTNVLNVINTMAMNFFGLSPKDSKTPKTLDFSLKDFEIVDLTLKKRIIRLKFFHIISRGKDIIAYCTSLRAAPTPAQLALEPYSEAFEACNQVLANPTSQNIDSYKQTLINFFSLDEKQAPATKFLDEFNKALKDRSKAFDWDVFLAILLVVGTIAIFSSFGWWRYSAMLKKRSSAATDFTEPMPHAVPVTVY